jgi:Amt family ammonium transporter
LIHGNPRLVLVQLIAVACAIAFSASVTAIVLLRLRSLKSLRVDQAHEVHGVDLSEHGELAYDHIMHVGRADAA